MFASLLSNAKSQSYITNIFSIIVSIWPHFSFCHCHRVPSVCVFSFFSTFKCFAICKHCLLDLLFPSSSDSESGSQLPCDQLVSPMALAACTRVDSCFAPWFVPSLGVSLQLAQMEVHLCHHLEQLGTGKTQNTQSHYITHRELIQPEKLPSKSELLKVYKEDCKFSVPLPMSSWWIMVAANYTANHHLL